jgi:hypothetical protein
LPTLHAKTGVWLCAFFLGVVALCRVCLAARHFPFRRKEIMKKVILWICLCAISLTAKTQTNKTDQLNSVRKAMPGYFTIQQDENGIKTITQSQDELLEQSSIDDLKLEVSTSIFPPEKLPYEISLHLIAHLMQDIL